jgi:hypothetical protein
VTVVYVISKYITVIGSVLKGFWEHLFCRIIGIPVQDARYLQTTELCGHVDHDFTKTKTSTFLICYLPGMMNRLFGYGMVIAGFLGLFHLKVMSNSIIFWVYAVLLYIGISLLCNNGPLYEDALNNWDLMFSKGSDAKLVAKIFAFLPSVYFLVSAWMEKYAISLLVYLLAIAAGIIFA